MKVVGIDDMVIWSEWVDKGRREVCVDVWTEGKEVSQEQNGIDRFNKITKTTITKCPRWDRIALKSVAFGVRAMDIKSCNKAAKIYRKNVLTLLDFLD